MLADPPADPTTEAAAVRSRESGALFDESRQGFRRYRQEKKKEYVRRIDTYAETFCGCFTTLRKGAAFAAASSRLVAAAVLLGLFGPLPNRLGAARRFCAPPRAADAVDEPAPWSNAG